MDKLREVINTLARESGGVKTLETLAALSKEQYEALKNLFEAFGVIQSSVSADGADSSFAKGAFDACGRDGRPHPPPSGAPSPKGEGLALRGMGVTDDD